ncbi:MAG: hemerythrin domain-containing protein [Nocardioidaceae bacterium]|nr:hemerythrin domain-containing protein [Nocardioidaceae bacterium]
MAPDVVDLIMADHREVERLFDKMREDPESRPMLLPTVTTLLIAHSRAEEAEVYPAARNEAGEADEVAHSQEEHAEAEELLVKLKQMDVSSADFDSTLDELIEAILHHVEEEEESVLPGLRTSLSPERLKELGEAFVEARAEHMGEQPGEATREELLIAARNAQVEGASSMSRDELQEAIKPDDSDS